MLIDANCEDLTSAEACLILFLPAQMIFFLPLWKWEDCLASVLFPVLAETLCCRICEGERWRKERGSLPFSMHQVEIGSS